MYITVMSMASFSKVQQISVPLKPNEHSTNFTLIYLNVTPASISDIAFTSTNKFT